MATPAPNLRNGSRLVVGSAASAGDLTSATADALTGCCDLVEVRLDLLDGTAARPWRHLDALPLLFTARRGEEGGSGNLSARQRMDLLQDALEDASLIDIEVASIEAMAPVLELLGQRGLPWIASFHDFEKLPENQLIEEACRRAREAGAQVFKLAAHLADEASLQRLIAFQQADHGLPTATMGMGPLGAQSRVRCAEAGSVLNYGYLGASPTAPGQMSAGELSHAIQQLPPFPA